MLGHEVSRYILNARTRFWTGRHLAASCTSLLAGRTSLCESRGLGHQLFSRHQTPENRHLHLLWSVQPGEGRSRVQLSQLCVSEAQVTVRAVCSHPTWCKWLSDGIISLISWNSSVLVTQRSSWARRHTPSGGSWVQGTVPGWTRLPSPTSACGLSWFLRLHCTLSTPGLAVSPVNDGPHTSSLLQGLCLVREGGVCVQQVEQSERCLPDSGWLS